MAVNRKKYGEYLEKEFMKTPDTQKAIKRAGALATPDKYQKPSLGDKVILAILRARKAVAGGSKGQTKRTMDINKQAKEKFGTNLQAELAKLRKKGKGK